MDGLDDTTSYPDADITAAIERAEELIDRYTGTSWVYRSFGVTLSGNGRRTIQLVDLVGRPVLYPQTLTAVTIDSAAVSGTSAWGLFPEGLIVRGSGTFPIGTVGRNVRIAGTAGLTSAAPKDIAWCARTIARQYLLDLLQPGP